MSRRVKGARALGALALLATVGCGSGGDGVPPRMCSWNVPASCPDGAVPSYASDVDPILARRCRMCHAPGGLEQGKPLVTYADVNRERVEILLQINGCKMPPADQPALPADEGQVLLQWLVCHAPNN